MPAKRKKKSKSIVSLPKFSKKSLMIFGLAFALIGGYLLFRIFAASQSVHYFGSLTSTKPTAAYTLTTGSGVMNISFTNNTADVTLTVRNKANAVMGSVLSKGRKAVKLDLTVPADTYTVTLTTTKKFTAKKGYAIDITYPIKDILSPTAVISEPLSKETIKGIVNFSAISQDDTAVDRVEFFVDGNLLEADKTSPYSVKWDTTKIPDGEHSFSVRSYDAAGNVGEASGSTNVLNTVKPTTTSRFPGDPNPKVSGKAYYGAAIGGNADPSKHETPTGVSLSIRRTFWQWSDVTNTSSKMYTTVKTDLDKNRLPFISIKVPSWAAVGSGTYDKEIDAMIKKLDSYGKPVWLVSHHEPEGGGGDNAPDDAGGPAAWRAMQTRIRQRMTAVGAKNIAFMPVLMSYTWAPGSGRTPDDWWVPGVWDAYIVDHYRDNVSGDLFTTGQWAAFVAWAEKRNIPFGTGEWGNRGTDAQAAKENQAFWDWGFNNKKDLIAQTYFDSGLNSPNGSWELTGETIKNFQTILKSDSRVQRINDLK